MKLKPVVLSLATALAISACSKQPDVPAAPAATPAGDQAAPAPTESATDAVAGTVVKTCNIETVDSQGFKPTPPTVAAGSKVRVTGWIIDASDKSVPSEVTVQLLGRNGPDHVEAPIAMWRARPDVVSAQNADAGLKPGFSVDVNLKALPPGDYSIYLLSSNAGGDFKCDVGRGLSIR
jgi:hypothetical protein